MRIVLQIVEDASVNIEGKRVAHIDYGFLLLVGFKEGDDESTMMKMLHKVLSLRIFPDTNGATNLSLEDVNGQVLSVSQFTLYADIKKGRRPTFSNALAPKLASPLYDLWVKRLKENTAHVESGVFGADMDLHFHNKGPFTLMIDSEEL